jgi:dTMP kinase
VLADRYIYTAFARDAVRGCDREWIRKLYSFARPPDITFFFKVPLDIALSRILDGRPQLKYHEAGMDLGYSSDPYESFRIFQGKIYEEYLRMVDEFDFMTIDAGEPPDVQQHQVRGLLQDQLDLPRYKWKR